MADGGLLSLSWNNHKATFCHILPILREKERYTDVTLACDGKFYQVHKLVLSTCSEYFENMFEHTPCKHPIIVLKDIKSDEVESLLSYMYAGVVNVAQSDLSRLIKAAEMLKVKGLAVPDEPPPQEETRKASNASPSWSSRDDRMSPPPKRRRQDSSADHVPAGNTNANSPSASPRHSPYHASSEYYQDKDTSRTSGNAADMGTERLEHDDSVETKHIPDLSTEHHSSAKPNSPLQVMLDETLVKEEVIEPVSEDQDTIVNSGIDYGSMGADGMLDSATSDTPSQQHSSTLFMANDEQQSTSQQQQQQTLTTAHLPEAVVEALAGPSGMQGWLSGGGEMGGAAAAAAFSGVDSYSGDGRHQDLRQPPTLPGQQPQAHQMEGKQSEMGRRGRGQGQGFSIPKKHSCPHCVYSSNNAATLKKHMRTHTKRRRFACPECPYRALSKDHLTKHMCTHSNEKPYACVECPYRASRKDRLAKHMSIHTGEKPNACPYCNYRTAHKVHLKTHISRHIVHTSS